MERKFHSAFTRQVLINYINVATYIYRYEDQKWIDNFFETGEILISSFKQYSQYEDNQLGDKSEGSSVNIGLTQDKHVYMSATKVGSDLYSFCTSTQLTPSLLKIFKRDGVFRIKDPINFMMAIEIALGNIKEVYFGNCIYLKQRSITKNIASLNLDEMKNNNGNGLSMEKMMNKGFKIGG